MSKPKSEEPTIEVKLFVDKEKSRVLFAETGKEFVDVLFSFLTLPLGTIVRVLGKQSQLGCLDEVYKSVEDLSTVYFQTKACKTMLLAPLNSAYDHCCRLNIKVGDSNNPRAVYVCIDVNCCAHGDSAFTSVSGAICKCGQVMQFVGDWPENGGSFARAGGDIEPGVFVKSCFRFIVTDDLRVAPASTSLMLSLFEKFEVRDLSNLEQKKLQLTSEKITSLLKRSLLSKQPLTGLYFDVPIAHDDAESYVLPENLYPKQEDDADHNLNNVKIRVLQTKNNSSLLYAEVRVDFVDLLFGLLVIPLGSIIKSFGQWSSKGCVDNLYNSIDGSAKECMRPDCQELLVSPKLAPFFGCGVNKILQVEEVAPRKQEISACFKCFKIGGFSYLGRCRASKNLYYCKDQKKTTNLFELDPKSPKGGSNKGEPYVKQVPQNFVVTDHLRVLPLSLASTVEAVSEAKIQTKELVEKEITLTKSQLLMLLKAALVTRNGLSSVLLPPKKKPRHLRYGVY